MPKQTLESALLARRNDPRALRGAISIVKGKPRIVFGVVGDHRRFSVDINGDEVVLVDDPRGEDAAEQTEEAPEADPAPEGGGDPVEDAQAAAEQPSEPETPAAEVEVEEKPKRKRGK